MLTYITVNKTCTPCLPSFVIEFSSFDAIQGHGAPSPSESVSDIHSHTEQKPEDLITLVIGFWVQANNETSHPHRLENKASIIANIENPYIHQVLIILDSVSNELVVVLS
jgi:hypothetical protein